MEKTIYREEWLQNAVDLLRPYFKEKGYEIPEQISVSCGWPSRNALSKKNRRYGEAWQSKAALDGIHQVFISPLISDKIQVLEILVHELLHTCLNDDIGHKKPFKIGCKVLGLEGPATGTEAGPELRAFLATICIESDYPQTALEPIEVEKKQSVRLLKLECKPNEEHEESYIIRTTKKALDIGIPTCPCGQEFVVEVKSEEEEDEA